MTAVQMARPRLLSLPSQITGISPRIKSNKIKMNPHFVWSARKIFSNDEKFERILQQVQPKTPQNESPDIIMNTPNYNMSESAVKNDVLSPAVGENKNLFLVGRCLFKSPVAIMRQAPPNINVNSERSYSNVLLTNTPEQKVSPGIMSPAVESMNNSICILEEIITVDGASDEEQAEKAKKLTENSHLRYKKNLEFLEYREYLRLKMKYEGPMKKRIGSRLRRAFRNENPEDDESDKDIFL